MEFDGKVAVVTGATSGIGMATARRFAEQGGRVAAAGRKKDVLAKIETAKIKTYAVDLLNERSKCALEIGKLKQQANLPLYQPEREREVLENAEQNNQGPLTDAAIRRLFERIIDEARSAERSAMHPDGTEKKT